MYFVDFHDFDPEGVRGWDDFVVEVKTGITSPAGAALVSNFFIGETNELLVRLAKSLGNPFTQFDSPNNAASGYTAHAGIEFRPTSNLSLSVSGSFSQQPDPNQLVLPGASPFGPRR